MTFTAVNTYDVFYTVITNNILYIFIYIITACCFEVDGNRNMKLEFVNSITTIFNYVIVKCTINFLVLPVFISYRIIRSMNCGFI